MREVDWDGLHNARDLGGLGAVLPARLFRTPRLDTLTASGWLALVDDGVRTIIDLRNPSEVTALDLPTRVTSLALPVEDDTDAAFVAEWGGRLNTPAYYPDVVERWPNLFVAVFRAIAAAEPGGIVVHCAGGRDRTGLVAAMLLQLAGVPDDEVVADYAASVIAMNEYFAVSESPHEPPLSDADLSKRVERTSELLRAFLSTFDTERYLLENGLAAEDVEQIQARLLKP